MLATRSNKRSRMTITHADPSPLTGVRHDVGLWADMEDIGDVYAKPWFRVLGEGIDVHRRHTLRRAVKDLYSATRASASRRITKKRAVMTALERGRRMVERAARDAQETDQARSSISSQNSMLAMPRR